MDDLQSIQEQLIKQKQVNQLLLNMILKLKSISKLSGDDIEYFAKLELELALKDSSLNF